LKSYKDNRKINILIIINFSLNINSLKELTYYLNRVIKG